MANLALNEELEYWTRSIRRNPRSPNSYVQRGMAHFKLAHIPELITYIVTAAINYPLEDYMWHLARVHQQVRQW